jgi:dihydroorotase
MEFTKLTEIELPAAFDAHVHLRDGEMSQLVTPTIRKGGVNQVYVMVRKLAYFSSTCYIFACRMSLCSSLFSIPFCPYILTLFFIIG